MLKLCIFLQKFISLRLQLVDKVKQQCTITFRQKFKQIEKFVG